MELLCRLSSSCAYLFFLSFFCKCDVLLKRNVQKQKIIQQLPLVLTWEKIISSF